MRKFKFMIQNQGDPKSLHEEEMDVPDDMTPKDYGEMIVKRFNDSLRKHEKPRELIDVLEPVGEQFLYCNFDKQNSFTIAGDGGMTFDIYRCKNCDLRKQAFGLSGCPPNHLCQPELLCTECNREFKTKSGIKKHNEKDKHKRPSWVDSTR